ncbi:hypothetical protein [Bradyrhizobium brasilense]|uniref:hypothetical protein n=1 Tax=Bradyrhizobium brasilense TaxID=1419277 RepID=UPI001E39B3BE|nr:hypothetical protein [Bradyrhizobium brasilense]MCC8970089.1 hypothetical protein [Bradyrhizobium brasilense]
MANRRRLRNLKAYLSQTERIDKYVDHANRAVLVNQVVGAFGAAAFGSHDLLLHERRTNSLKDSRGNRNSSPVFSLPGRVADISE